MLMEPAPKYEASEQIPLSNHQEAHGVPSAMNDPNLLPSGNTQIQIEDHESPEVDRYRKDDNVQKAIKRQRSLATIAHPYTDKEVRLRARFRKTIDFPISSTILMNSKALAHTRTRIPALQGIHWPHVRFLKDHPQWTLQRHRNGASLSHREKTGWELMSQANRVLVLSCCLAWCGYYICRSHVSVLLPVISQETGLSFSVFSMVLSAGLITTAIGKVMNGMLADRYGGQIMFTFYLLLAALTTVLMALSSTVDAIGLIPVFAFWVVIWCLNRWFHSGAWGAMILLLSVQLPHRSYGCSLSIVSLGYGGGDMLARVAYGLMLSAGMKWNATFLIGALMSSICAIPSMYIWSKLPRKTTSSTSESAPDAKPKAPDKPASHSLTTKAIIRALMYNRPFVVMTISYSVMAVLREILFTWTTVFLVGIVGTDTGTASMISLFLPVCMVASANITGYVADHVEGLSLVRWLQFVPTVIVTASCVALTVLMTILKEAAPKPLIVILLIVMCLFGEIHNTFIEGFQFVALSASVNRPATVSGLISFCSNFGSTASSLLVGAILGANTDTHQAWIAIYYFMCVCAAITAISSFRSLSLGQLSPTCNDAKLIHLKESSIDSLASTVNPS